MTYPALLAFLAAFAACSLALPAVRRLGMRFGLYDQPGALKIHDRPVVRLGGIAILLGLAAGALLALRFAHSTPAFATDVSWPQFWLALGLLWLVSFADDLRGLGPLTRLAAQACSAALLWHAGWRLPFTSNVLVSAAATILFVVLMINSFNMLDGMDGLAAGVSVIIAIGYLPLFGHSAQGASLLLAASFAGACLAFLARNFPPAAIYMGDSGSTVLGFVAASLSLSYAESRRAGAAGLALPLLFAALPLADALWAVVRRLGAGHSPLLGDRAHFYDRLLRKGWSVRAVALFSYAVTFGLVLAGFLQTRWLHVVAAYGSSAGVSSIR